MLPMFSFLLGFIMASSPSPDRKHGLYRQPSRFGCERSRFRSPAGPVFCIGPHHPKPDQPRPLWRGGARRVLLPVRRVPPTARVGCYYVGGGGLLLVAPVSGPRYLLVRRVDHP
ncbi:hypothetical protein PF003_g41050 [Phytophthora fragariae]|nr:hypothetical protein PF003_g41050 [Phytophthora fragariae]